MKYGFVKTAAAVPELKVAACSYNTQKIINIVNEAEATGVELIVFPELSITAYSCGDLFHQEQLLSSAVTGLGKVTEALKGLRTIAIVGLPLMVDNQLFNCGAVLQNGEILGIVPKTYIPGYNEFYEERWFASGRDAKSSFVDLLGKKVPFGTDLLFESVGSTATSELDSVCFGVEICEDLWAPIPPSSYQATAGASIIFNLSASNEIIGKAEYRRELVRQQSGKCIAGYVFVSCGVHESTTDVVFGGHAMIAENGGILAEARRYLRDGHMLVSEIDVQRLKNDRIKSTTFMEGAANRDFRKIPFMLYGMDMASPDGSGRMVIDGTAAAGNSAKIARLARYVDPHPFVPSDKASRDSRCEEIFAIQTAGLAKRLEHTGIKKAVLGISGGLDSTLAFIATAKAFDILGIPRENILAVTMPGFGTTDATYENALRLIESFGAELREINIKKACLQHFEDIGHDPSVHDVTYENVQARERTQILMDLANKLSGLVVGTGDLSELALGWCTYNGDHMSMYSVNSGIPKTLVRYLVRWAADNMTDKAAADVLRRILDTPISPELLPPDDTGRIQQKTEDIIGPYELHDFFMYHMLRYGAAPKKLLFLAEQAFEGIYDPQTIKSWLKVFIKRFFSQQFKRSCLPDGPKVGTISLSPRGDWRMPSDASAEVWLKELE
ncbi:MAG: NAD(+) synthase [Clostridiaceae bacterium]|nr:NAD(+) synthase [Clostridiaceae bacterium]